MKNIEKYIMVILIFIAVGAIGAAVYFGINADQDNSKKGENKQEEVLENDNKENLTNDDNDEIDSQEQEYISCENENYKVQKISATDFNELTSQDFDFCTKYEIENLGFTVIFSKDKSSLGLDSYFIVDENHPNKSGFELKSTDLNFLKLYNKRTILSYGVMDNFEFILSDNEGYNSVNISTFGENNWGFDYVTKISNDALVINEIEIKNEKALFKSSFVSDEEIIGSHDNLIKDISSYCKNNEKILNITYELVEENNTFKLVEKEFKCS